MKKFFYRVMKGDSVFLLSAKFNTPAIKIIQLNKLTKEVQEGDMLYVEVPEKVYRVKLCETAEEISKKFSVSVEELKRKNGTDYFFFSQVIEV